MFIQTEATPNPATLKFVPGRPVLGGGTADFRSRGEADKSPLAERLRADASGMDSGGRRFPFPAAPFPSGSAVFGNSPGA